LLIQINTELSNIELETNDLLENSTTVIEKEMKSLNKIRGSLDLLRSHVSKLYEDVIGAKSDLCNLETNMSALGYVFDTVRETAEANRTL
jgi:hypothetical protein